MKLFSRSMGCGFLLLASGSFLPGHALAQKTATAKIAFTRVREDVTKPGDYRTEAEIWVMDADGTNARRLTHNTSDDFGAVWSPDSKTIAFGAVQFVADTSGELKVSTSHIYTIAADGGEPVRLTPIGMHALFPSWSVDGRITFHGGRGEARQSFEIFTMRSDGSALVQLTENVWNDARPDWSPNGSKIAFQSNRSGSMQIHVMNADGSDVIQLTKSDSGVANVAPAWSPDGKRLVFQSDRDGNPEVYVMKSDGTAQTRVTNYEGRDVDPEWTSDGTRIVFDREVQVGDKNVKQLYLMNADGTGLTALTVLPSSNSHAAWTLPDS